MSGTYKAHTEAMDPMRYQKPAKKQQWSGRASSKPYQNFTAAKYTPADPAEEYGEDAMAIHEEEVQPDEQASELPVLSFSALGFDPTLVDALHTAFPNVQEPTRIQERLIPAILSGKDVLLRDGTGSGKCVPKHIRYCSPDVCAIGRLD